MSTGNEQHDGDLREDQIRRALARYLEGEMTGDQEEQLLGAMQRAGELGLVLDAVRAQAEAQAVETRVVRLDLLATWGGSFVVAAAGLLCLACAVYVVRAWGF